MTLNTGLAHRIKMASSSIIHVFFLLLVLFSVSSFSAPAHYKPKPKPKSEASGFTLPVMRDSETSMYYTSVSIGTPPHKMNLTIDLGGPILWYDCNTHYNSSSYRPLHCNSKECPNPPFCTGCDDGDFKPGCSNTTCGVDIINPFANFVFFGDKGEDVIFMSRTKAPRFVSACIDSDRIGDGRNLSDVIQGLPKPTKGIIGLSRSQFAFPTQFALANKLPHKFALCLPSSNRKGFGNIFMGSGGPHSLSKFLSTTPLVTNPKPTVPFSPEGEPSNEYFISVKSISVDGKVVNFKPSMLSIDKNGNGGTKISSMSPFTTLHSSIFKPLVKDFVKKASDRKMKKVKGVREFEACFDASRIGKSSTGLDVPTIDLELEGGVKWSVFGANSMVRVKKNVVCLGFVDGGKEPTDANSIKSTSIVIGGHVLEDNLLEFDVASSKLSFSSSLLLRNASCSHPSSF